MWLAPRDAAGDGANLPALLDLYHDRAERAEADATRWRKVAPLIERLRAVCGDPPFTGRRPQLADCAAAILAATQEPTP